MIKKIPGLTANESIVYTTLLNLKESGATKISEKSGLFRTLVYDILTKLVEKGLVSYIKKSDKRIYHPASPNRLLELIKEKEHETTQILPELNSLFEESKEELQVDQFEGANGMKVIVEDMISSAIKGTIKEVFFLGPTGQSFTFFESYFKHASTQVKQKKLLDKIDFRVIWSSELKTKEIIKMFGTRKNHRFMPEGFTSSAPFLVYGDKFVINGGKIKPFIISIKNKETADSFKHYFNFIWQHLK